MPKSGSKSLSRLAAEAFADRPQHYVPDTMRREALISRWQAFRLRRSQTQNLMKRYGTASLPAALAKIEAAARPGDLLIGGHADYATMRDGLSRPVRFVTLLREPGERARSDYNYARAGYLRRRPWQRFDSHIAAKIAGRFDFEGFLSYQLQHPQAFADLASAYVGWTPGADLEAHLAASLWDWGVLEESEAFARRVSERVGKPLVFGRSNTTGQVEQLDISAAERRLVDRLYARDLELYERARKPA
ncbi:hypothetical protein QO010_002683 [Caulobacter ginsengisoli]|uniref:Sulfotransferase family protein n=1 Tax=Caulobacter ginsengisoli TaxID=400775 RepID=A0ABU0ISD4_9CAUL|nr:hypothetical protein [Caulobacter ginsengisoli]